MESTGPKRKLAAILMADVVEYGRLMGEDEAATIRTLKAHRQRWGFHLGNVGSNKRIDSSG